jgi:hypothetical protein
MTHLLQLPDSFVDEIDHLSEIKEIFPGNLK